MKLRFSRDGEDSKAVVNIRIYGKKKITKISLSMVDLCLAQMAGKEVDCTATSEELPKVKKGKKK